MFNQSSILVVLLGLVMTMNGYAQEKNYPAGIPNSLGMEMIPIKPGEFRMGNDGEIDYKKLLKDELHTPYLGKGSPNPYIKDGPLVAENPLEWDEKPAHTVKISQTFYMASTPVTNAQYEQFRQ